MTKRPPSKSSPSLSGPVAVVDVETTGLLFRRSERIVEIAVLRLELDGMVSQEFASVVNPRRDVGPSHVHGLTAQVVGGAPEFRELVPHIASIMDGCVAIVGHNVRFDASFLERELERCELSLPPFERICTMCLSGGQTLSSALTHYGIKRDGDAHSALSDARCAAQLLLAMLPDLRIADLGRSTAAKYGFPKPNWAGAPPVARVDRCRAIDADVPPITRLLRQLEPGRISVDAREVCVAYLAVLAQVLDDRRVADYEATALFDSAKGWGLGREDVESLHSEFLVALCAAAVADGSISRAERVDVAAVAKLLGLTVDTERLLDQASDRLGSSVAARRISPVSLAPLARVEGQRVCFTGELQCTVGGTRIRRKQAEAWVYERDMFVQDGVTKALNILVVADPYTDSGKAKRARELGVRIVHEPVFWSMLGVKVD